MRGLPPLPPDFITITATWRADVGECVTVWDIFAPGADAATTLQLNDIATAFYLGPVADLLSVLPANVTLSLLRVSSYGTAPQTIAYAPAPNAGAFGDCTWFNVASCLTWRTAEPRLGASSHTRLPIAEEQVSDDKRHVTSIFYSQLQAAARAWVQHVNAIPSPDGALLVAAVVHRSARGVPLSTSTWSPVVVGDASIHVATLRRRGH